MPHLSAECSSKRFTFTTDLFYNHSKMMLPDNTDLDSCLMKCLKISFLKGAQLPWLRCAFLVKLWLYTIQTLILRKRDSKATEKKPSIHDKTITVTVCCVCSILKTPWNVYLKILFKKIKNKNKLLDRYCHIFKFKNSYNWQALMEIIFELQI